MNRIWLSMVVISICFLIWQDPASILSNMIDASADALKLAIELCAVYAVWLGILELVEASGLSQKLARLLHPLIKKLFKIDDPEAEKMIALNMSANMLGLGNAATPMGISAMKRLDDGSGTATHAIIMLIVLNSTSIQLLPSTVIGLRTAAGSTSPSDIIFPTLISTICTFLLGIILVKFFGVLHEKYKIKKAGKIGKSYQKINETNLSSREETINKIDKPNLNKENKPEDKLNSEVNHYENAEKIDKVIDKKHKNEGKTIKNIEKTGTKGGKIE